MPEGPIPIAHGIAGRTGEGRPVDLAVAVAVSVRNRYAACEKLFSRGILSTASLLGRGLDGGQFGRDDQVVVGALYLLF
jgi:hypothetical protein